MTPADPNVLLVVLDSVRAGNVSCYGHGNETTPFLDALAGEEATRYAQARSPGSWSLPSHTSLFTGRHVAEHRVTEPDHRLDPGHTVFEELRADGYETAVVSENPWLTFMDVGLDAGFETVVGPQNVPFPEGLNPTEFTAAEGQGNYRAFLRTALDHDHTVKSLANGVLTKLAWDYPRLVPERFSASAAAGVYVDRFLEWHADAGGPWAACVNLMDAHAPYEPAPDHDRWGKAALRRLQDDLDKHVWSFHGGDTPWWQARAFEALYDGAIRETDAALERLLGALDDRDELDDTLVVVTSDHGEGFGEFSRLKPDTRVVGHVEGIHEAQLRVPLVVRHPGQREAETVAAPASLTEFPRVVRAAREGERGSFVPEGPVVASSHGLTAPNMELAESYCDPDYLWRFRGDMRCVYEADGDGTVAKYAAWEEETVTVRCRDAGTSYRERADDGGRVAAAFDGFEPAGIRGDGTGVGDVGEAARQRLRDLGYAE